MKIEKARAKHKTVEICILRCQCGCREEALCIGDTRVTDNSSGGPWKVLQTFEVKLETLVEALGVTGYD